MNTTRTLLLATLCSVCLAFPSLRLQRERRDTGNAPDPEPQVQSNPSEEVAANITQGYQSVFDRISKANNETIFTGKYIITNLDIADSVSKSASPCPHGVCLWPKSSDGNVYIPYVIPDYFGSLLNSVISSSLSDMQDVTCIRFIKKTTETDYIDFKAAKGCWSPVGFMGGAQTLSLEEPDCVWTGVVIHEVLHALGLNHEHVRFDRDNYVEVQWNNIQQSARSNFEMSDTYNNDLTAYDYRSIMHYKNTAYSSNNLPTLIPILNNSIQLGSDFALSALDIVKINTLYNCSIAKKRQILTAKTWYSPPNREEQDTTQTAQSTTTITTTTTRTPKTTTTTIRTASSTTTTATTPSTTTTTRSTTTTTRRTPSTTTTTRITPRTITTTTIATTTTTKTTAITTSTPTIRVLNGCGGTLTGSEGIFTSPNFPNNYPNNAKCHWNITTDTQFRVTFTDFDIAGNANSCVFNKLRIYDGKDFSVLYQLRDLCGKNLPSPIDSSGNSMQFLFTSDSSVAKRGFRVIYQPVK
ncbi:high choriolytic enzyme 2-like [Dendropsophus ebraccatus]|uniref:high choriolytic enzyme 2-like n=1 Tax=Dendropsophus ebraccatus TaxID=150705 RepID=UPI00383190E9